jgi:hypothetical protein
MNRIYVLGAAIAVVVAVTTFLGAQQAGVLGSSSSRAGEGEVGASTADFGEPTGVSQGASMSVPTGTLLNMSATVCDGSTVTLYTVPVGK